MEAIVKFFGDFFNHLMQEHPENVLFYIINTIMIVIVMIKNKEAFKRGMEGTNTLWESPEIVIYIWLWIFPQSINAVLFLQLHPPDMFWYFMVLCLLFALAGKEGIMMLFNWRGVPIERKEPEPKQDETIK